MADIYEFLGIIFRIYTKEHYPVHIHARYGNQETVFEFIIENGNIIGLKRRKSHRGDLSESQMRDAEKIIWQYRADIYSKFFTIVKEKKKVKKEFIHKKTIK